MNNAVGKKLAAALELEQVIVNAIHDYVEEDETKAGFGIHAAFRACIGITKNSTLNPQARMMLAQRVFMDMTEDLTPSVIRRTPQ